MAMVNGVRNFCNSLGALQFSSYRQLFHLQEVCRGAAATCAQISTERDWARARAAVGMGQQVGNVAAAVAAATRWPQKGPKRTQRRRRRRSSCSRWRVTGRGGERRLRRGILSQQTKTIGGKKHRFICRELAILCVGTRGQQMRPPLFFFHCASSSSRSSPSSFPRHDPITREM